MDPLSADVESISQVIQLAIAPIFLLVGTGAILNVVTVRLSRVVDRVRYIEEALDAGEEGAIRDRHLEELAFLDQRMTLANRSIGACVSSALLVCVTVALLFSVELAHISLRSTVAALFITAMGCLIFGLIVFLREVFVASKSLRVRSEWLRAASSVLDKSRK